MSLWFHVEKAISSATGKPYKISRQKEVGGGCINSAYHISDGNTDWFVKTNTAAMFNMFSAEAEALIELAASATIRVPNVLCYDRVEQHSYLVLEYLPLTAQADMQLFAKQLAAMHKQTASHFGWHRDNVIGATPQSNTQQTDWISFWREQRLQFQLDLAKSNGCGKELLKQGERLSDCLEDFFQDYQPKPSMLHGDLWGGNYAALADRTPVIFDPAFYYGDRETDLAMTRLFGGFNADFYQAYQQAWPLDVGFESRRKLYNVYHMINHFNLFGGAYESQAVSMMTDLMSEGVT